MPNHPIKKGPEGGSYQHSKAGDRYLLDKPVKAGPYGGHYQTYGKGGKEKRYLLECKNCRKK